MKNIFKFLCLLTLISPLCAYSQDYQGYEVEIHLQDGTVERYAGSTSDGRMPDYNFGYMPEEIVEKKWKIVESRGVEPKFPNVK
jgi:hypothetical protein